MLLLVFLFMVFATYRLTRLVVHDDFPPVQWVRDRLTEGPAGLVTLPRGGTGVIPRWRWVPSWVGDLVTCHWCASAWCAAIVVLGTLPWASIPLPVLTWAAVAGLAPLVSHVEEYLTRE